jgi:uncharacterized integral membrane protein
MIRLILVAILLLLSLTFFLQNQEEETTLHYLFGLKSISTPVYKPILTSFVVGILVATILLFPAWVQGRMALRKKTKALQEIEQEFDRLRQSLRAANGSSRGSGGRPGEGEDDV